MTKHEIFEWAEGKIRIRFNPEMERIVREEFSFLRDALGDDIKNPIYIAAIKNRWECYDDLPECESDLCDKKKAVKKGGREFLKSCGNTKCAKRINYLNGGYKVDSSAAAKRARDTINRKRDSISLEDSRYKNYSFDEIQDIVNERIPLYFKNQESFELLAKIKDLTSFLPDDSKREARVYAIRHDIREVPRCKVCSREVQWTDRNSFPDTCSFSCARKLSNQTFKERRGCYSIQRADVKEKALEGLQDFFNDEERVEEVTRKRRENCQEKHGRDHPSQIHMPDKSYQLLNDKEKLEEVYSAIGAYGIELVYRIPNQTTYRKLKKHGIRLRGWNRSAAEIMLESFINDELGIETRNNDRDVLEGLEIDIMVPSKNIGIEFNGVHWHSTKVLPEHIAKIYHKKKTEKAAENGVRLIHIFEDEWAYNMDVVKKKLKSILCPPENKVFARKTKVVEVSAKDARVLLEDNHIQGTVGANVRLGLEYEGELVAVMLFADRKDGNWELVRYGTSVSVVGGFSKLLKHFERTYQPKSITSFADARWSVGDVYLKNGFDLVYTTPPEYFYVSGKKRIRKNNFRRSKMEKMEGFDFNPEETEKENTERNGFSRVYDCGLLKYVKTL